jgi:CheY-like chemotaxis protein
LVVEDDRVNRDSLRRLLAHLGFAVEAAATVREGLSKLADEPHCLLLDVHLPDGTGIDVARAARAANADCKIAFLTGSATEPGLGFKADAFFRKPVMPDEVLQWVQHCCRDGDGDGQAH